MNWTAVRSAIHKGLVTHMRKNGLIQTTPEQRDMLKAIHDLHIMTHQFDSTENIIPLEDQKLIVEWERKP